MNYARAPPPLLGFLSRFGRGSLEKMLGPFRPIQESYSGLPRINGEGAFQASLSLNSRS